MKTSRTGSKDSVMTLWSQDAISTDVALTAKIPIFTYGKCLLKCIAEHVLIMQPMTILKPRNWDTDDFYENRVYSRESDIETKHGY